MVDLTKAQRKRLGVALGVVFMLALVMGPGPGIYLVNPDPSDPGARFTLWGMPIIYVWAVFWFFVQAAVVLLAYFLVWDRDNGPRA